MNEKPDNILKLKRPIVAMGAEIGGRRLYIEEEYLVCKSSEGVERIALEVLWRNPRKILGKK